MAEQTNITWTDHTWSPWWGCTKVSTGCANCYAAGESHRWGHNCWGDDAPRRMLSAHHWHDPLRWNKKAEQAGIRRRIFPSMCDPFEDRPDLVDPRKCMFDLIDATPNLDWILCTKRPENILPMWAETQNSKLKTQNPRPNVYLLASVEDQPTADQRIPALLQCRALAPVLGLSIEPLLGPVDLSSFIVHRSSFRPWIIVGGESGSHARPMHPAWPRSIRDQCQSAAVPFFFKQWGEFAPREIAIKVFGKDYDPDNAVKMARVGKLAAGDLLDGRQWHEFPSVVPPPPVPSPAVSPGRGEGM